MLLFLVLDVSSFACISGWETKPVISCAWIYPSLVITCRWSWIACEKLHLQDLLTKTGHINGMEAFPGWETDGSRSIDFLHGLLPILETLKQSVMHYVYESSRSKYRLSVLTIPMMCTQKMTCDLLVFTFDSEYGVCSMKCRKIFVKSLGSLMSAFFEGWLLVFPPYK